METRSSLYKSFKSNFFLQRKPTKQIQYPTYPRKSAPLYICQRVSETCDVNKVAKLSKLKMLSKNRLTLKNSHQNEQCTLINKNGSYPKPQQSYSEAQTEQYSPPDRQKDL